MSVMSPEQEAQLRRIILTAMRRAETRRNTLRRKAEASRKHRTMQKASRRRNRGAA